MKRLLSLSVLLLMTIASFADGADMTLKDATNVTQTKATLSAEFPDLSAPHGFQYKYGTIPERTEFFKYATAATCDPLTFTQGSKAWRQVESQGWVESCYDKTSPSLTSEFSTTVTLTESTPITFEWKVSSQENTGKLQFVVDGTVVSSITGETNFTTVSYNLDAGKHTLKWQYVRTTTETIGDGIGQLRNINIQNTTKGEWIDVSTTSSTVQIENIYPSQNYVFRAYSTDNEEITYSIIRQFNTKDISLGDPRVINTTQTTATVECDIEHGDADVKAMLKYFPSRIGRKADNDSFMKVFYNSETQYAPKPTYDSNAWQVYYTKDKVYTTSSTYNEAYISYITITFTLHKASFLSFNYDTQGGSLYYVEDGNTIKNPNFNKRILEEGTHIIKFGGYSNHSGNWFQVNLSNVKIQELEPDSIALDCSNQLLTATVTDLRPGTINHCYVKCSLNNNHPYLPNMWESVSSPITQITTDDVKVNDVIISETKQSSAILKSTYDCGDVLIIEKGIQYCLDDSDDWLYANIEQKGDTINAILSSLIPSTTYKCRSYVQPKGEERIYSNIASFVTKSITVQIPTLVNVTQKTAIVRGVTDVGNARCYSRGLQFREKNGEWIDVPSNDTDTILIKEVNLKANSPYEARTYVERVGGFLYSDILSFKTNNIEIVVDSIVTTQTTATIHAHASFGDDISAKIQEEGRDFECICGNNSLRGKHSDSIFVRTFRNLIPNTTYSISLSMKNSNDEVVIASGKQSAKTKNVELYVDSITDIYQRSAIVHGRIVRGDAVSDKEAIRIYKTTEKYGNKEKDAQYEFTSNGFTEITSSGEEFLQKIQLEPGYVYGVEAVATINGKEFSTGIPKLNVSTVSQNNQNFVASLTKSGSSQYCQVVNKDSYWTYSNGYVVCSRSSSTFGYNMPLTISFELKESATISFNWSVSGTEKYVLAQRTGVTGTSYGYLYSKLQCYVDGQLYESIASNNSTGKQTIDISLGAGIHTIEWRTSAYDEFRAKVYNLYVPRNAVKLLTDENKVCYAPSFIENFQTNNITQTTAQIQAEVVPTNESGVTYYFKKSENDVVESSVGNDVLTANLTGLIQNTDYTYYAVAKTSDGLEYLSDAITFKTSAVGVKISTSNVTQTTATINVKTDAGTATISKMQYRLDNGEWQNLSSDKITLSDLVPNNSYTVYLQWTVGSSSYSNYISFKTSAVSIYPCTLTPKQTSALLKMGIYYTGTTTRTESGIIFGGETYPLTTGETIRLTGLMPNTKYSYTYFVETIEDGRVSGTGSFSTTSVTTVTKPATNISNRSATLNGTIECDDYSGADFGFQWKTKQNWTTAPRFTKGRKGDDGTISVSLVNGMLSPDTEYQFRTAVRYGKNSDGSDVYYYGEWRDFRTESEFIVYPATPYTMYRTDSENNRLILCGYYIAGSEDIVSQGYEYWLSGNASNSLASMKDVRFTNDGTANDKQIVTTDESMEGYIDLSTLDDGVYSIRAFVTTTTSTYYGQQLTFSVGDASAIDNISESEPTCIILKGQIVLKNVKDVNVCIADVNGHTVYNTHCDNAVETFYVQPGIYIIKLNGTKTIKVAVK